jgi:uncharacterized protein (TIGR03083 family)
LSGERAINAATVQNSAFLQLLGDLTEEQWKAQTDCDLWTVRDVAAHLLGWAEAAINMRELGHQTKGGWKRRKDFEGNLVDAQNQLQVEERASLSNEELLARLEAALPRFMVRRRKLGKVGRGIFFYDPSILKGTNLAYLVNVIFTRDMFMHRIDITRAIGQTFETSREEWELIADIVRDWARRTKMDATITLSGDAGGTFIAGSGGVAHISGDVAEFCRVMAGRQDPGAIDIEGDRARALEWLSHPAPF